MDDDSTIEQLPPDLRRPRRLAQFCGQDWHLASARFAVVPCGSIGVSDHAREILSMSAACGHRVYGVNPVKFRALVEGHGAQKISDLTVSQRNT